MTDERVEALYLSAFRGIPRSFELDLQGGRSLAVLGPNASGKSSVADALEWHFSGAIELLQHEGREQDVRHRGANEAMPTFVRIDTTGKLGGETWQDAGLGPEPCRRAVGETYLLRGRTLSEFVSLTKGDKWKRFASLLGLQEVDELRLDVQSVRNKLGQALEASERHLAKRAQGLEPLWEEASEDGLWTAILKSCESAGVMEPDSLDQALTQDWSDSIADKDPESDHAHKLERLFTALVEIPELDIDVTAWNANVLVLQEPAKAEFSLLKSADVLLGSQEHHDACPLCGHTVDREALLESVSSRLSGLLDDSIGWEQAEATLATTVAEIADGLSQRQRLVELASDVNLTLPELPADSIEHLLAACRNGVELEEGAVADARVEIATWGKAVSSTVEADPDTDVDKWSPIVRLVRLLERGRVWQHTVTERCRLQTAAARASSIYEGISQQQSELLKQVLEAISDPLAEIYSMLHPDESLNAAKVERWGEKGLELSIEFYGQRRRPPHGVLSESHLNSLAIAVFLAMAETFNEKMGFLVLDDVVSSFDIEHRADLAEMLVHRYQDWQVILLTHDRLFFERIRKLAPDWQAIELTSWDYEEGPRLSSYVTSDQIARARSALCNGDLSTAAAAVRRALEEVMQEICEGVSAPVPLKRGFRNDRREVQELIDGLRRILKGFDSSSRTTLRKKLKYLEVDLQAALNTEAHASQEWASMGEIVEALDRVEEFTDLWTCRECSTRVWHSWAGSSGSCRCGRYQAPPFRDPSTEPRKQINA